jgi:hypothetical protein
MIVTGDDLASVSASTAGFSKCRIFSNWRANTELPLREHSPVRNFSKFYGQWEGDTHLEECSEQNLTRILAAEIEECIPELSCHPSYAMKVLKRVVLAFTACALSSMAGSARWWPNAWNWITRSGINWRSDVGCR